MGHDDADTASSKEVTFEASHHEVGAQGAADRLVVSLDVDQPEAEAADPARQTAPGDDRHLPPLVQANPPAVEQHRGVAPPPRRAAEAERALVLEKELALLGEEQAETREVNLLLVRLDLGEVGIDGDVGR